MGESPRETETFDVLVIGAGPTGMACAIEAQRAGYRAVLIDKGCLCNSLFHYPTHMTFFTTSELLEIGDVPFPSPNAKPTRTEALEYYRKVAMFYKLDVRPYQRVEEVSGQDLDFTVRTVDEFGRTHRFATRKLVVRDSGRGSAQGSPLLQRSAPVLRAGHPGDRWEKLRSHRGARTVASRGARHPGPSRPFDAPPRVVLDQA
jgi:choline dehydrogenase-like flavoprotein